VEAWQQGQPDVGGWSLALLLMLLTSLLPIVLLCKLRKVLAVIVIIIIIISSSSSSSLLGLIPAALQAHWAGQAGPGQAGPRRATRHGPGHSRHSCHHHLRYGLVLHWCLRLQRSCQVLRKLRPLLLLQHC
jgi:hypothetical protein